MRIMRKQIMRMTAWALAALLMVQPVMGTMTVYAATEGAQNREPQESAVVEDAVQPEKMEEPSVETEVEAETDPVAQAEYETEAETVSEDTTEHIVEEDTSVCEETSQPEAEQGADDVLYSGTDGDLQWTIDVDGHLVISGQGNYDIYYVNSWKQYGEEIRSATVNVTGITSIYGMFEDCENLASVDLRGLDTSAVTDMSFMFSGCSNLTSIDLSSFDTNAVTDMGDMFSECNNLTSLNLGGFDTSAVTDTAYMFYGCDGLINLNVSGFNTSAVRSGCK